MRRLLLEYDLMLTYFIYSALSNPVSMSISVAFSIAFSFISLIIVSFSLYFINRDRRFLLVMFTVTLTSIIVSLMKLIFTRQRPLLNSVFIPLVDWISYSFPSGHAALTASVMTLFVYFSKRYRLLAILCIVLSGFSRVIVGMHYFSDVIGGIAVGVLIAILCINFSDKIFSVEPRINKILNRFYQKI